MTHEVLRLNIQTIIDHVEPALDTGHLDPPTWTKIAQNRLPRWLRRRRQRSIILRIEKRERQHTITRQHPSQCTNRLHHLVHINMREHRERDDEIKLHATAIRDREIANAMRVVLRAVAIEVDEMRARVREPSLLDDRAIDVDTPVVFMVHPLAGTLEKRADIAAEVEYLSTLPFRMA